MEKRKIELGVAALAAGAGVAVLAARNHKTAVETEVKKAAGAATGRAAGKASEAAGSVYRVRLYRHQSGGKGRLRICDCHRLVRRSVKGGRAEC